MIEGLGQQQGSGVRGLKCKAALGAIRGGVAACRAVIMQAGTVVHNARGGVSTARNYAELTWISGQGGGVRAHTKLPSRSERQWGLEGGRGQHRPCSIETRQGPSSMLMMLQ